MRKREMVRLEIEGVEMAVRVAGDREKPALLLIHGHGRPSFRVLGRERISKKIFST